MQSEGGGEMEGRKRGENWKDRFNPVGGKCLVSCLLYHKTFFVKKTTSTNSSCVQSITNCSIIFF